MSIPQNCRAVCYVRYCFKNENVASSDNSDNLFLICCGYCFLMYLYGEIYTGILKGNCKIFVAIHKSSTVLSVLNIICLKLSKKLTP
jgi:hypothetical protein